MTGRALVVVTLLLWAAGSQTSARERKVTRADVPAAAIEAVLKKYPDAKLEAFSRETDDGQVLFEVQALTASKGKVSIDVTAAGKIMAEETTIDVAALPAAIKKGLARSRFKGWRIDRCERVVEQERDAAPSFELVVRSKQARFEVVFDKDGTLVREEPKSAADTD